MDFWGVGQTFILEPGEIVHSMGRSDVSQEGVEIGAGFGMEQALDGTLMELAGGVQAEGGQVLDQGGQELQEEQKPQPVREVPVVKGTDEGGRIKREEKEDSAFPEYTKEQLYEEKITRMEGVIERLVAQMDGLKDSREGFNQRIADLSEHLGEVRMMIADHEKEARTLRAQAERAIDMVESTKPDELLKEVRKKDFRLEAIENKLEANKAVMDRIIEEMQDVRKSVSSFRGLEAVEKMRAEMQDDLQNLRKIQTIVEKESDKTATLYTEFRSEGKRLAEMKVELDSSTDGVHELQRGMEKVRLELGGYLKRKDLDDMVKGFVKKQEEAVQLIQRLKSQEEVFREIVQDSQLMTDVQARLELEAERKQSMEKRIEYIEVSLDELRKMKASVTNMDAKLAKIEKRTEGLAPESSYELLKDEIRERKMELESFQKGLEAESKKYRELIEEKVLEVDAAKEEIKQVNKFEARIAALGEEINQLADNEARILELVSHISGK